jgi:hypothetical protein
MLRQAMHLCSVLTMAAAMLLFPSTDSCVRASAGMGAVFVRASSHSTDKMGFMHSCPSGGEWELMNGMVCSIHCASIAALVPAEPELAVVPSAWAEPAPGIVVDDHPPAPNPHPPKISFLR